jgi:hypothetical protein
MCLLAPNNSSIWLIEVNSVILFSVAIFVIIIFEMFIFGLRLLSTDERFKVSANASICEEWQRNEM